ncbi:hypothetical protein [Pseudomonas aeruginosa]|uniref:hypothetical protein n=1 Tax=Pseudomonas aeruginosa TaxID=287 RepID=UPI0012FD0A15|nr:hypothetical protein [Pseudomonas aeruginosa]
MRLTGSLKPSSKPESRWRHEDVFEDARILRAWTSIGIAISQWFIFVLEMRLGAALGYIVGLGPVLLVLCILGSFLQWLIHKHLEKKQ